MYYGAESQQPSSSRHIISKPETFPSYPVSSFGCNISCVKKLLLLGKVRFCVKEEAVRHDGFFAVQ